jgi:hypothetical protein
MRRFCAVWRACDPVLSLVLLAGVAAVVLFSRDLPWRGEWMWTLDWAAGTTILTGPLTAGLAAYESARWRSVTAELVLPTARRRLAACFMPALAVLASSTVVYLVGTLVVLGISGRYHPTDQFAPYLWLIGLCELGLCTAIGWLLGSRLQSYVAASLAAGGCYVLAIVSSTNSTLAFWRVGGSTGPPTGSVVNVGYTSGAAVLFLGLSGVMAALYLIQWTRTHRVAQVAAGLSVAVTGLGLVLTSAPGATYNRVDAHPHRLCRGAPVSVCLLAGNTSQLDSWSQLMNRAARPLHDVGVAFPPRYEQPTADAHSLAVGVVFFDPGTINISPPSHLYVAESLATPATCPAFAIDPPPIQALDAREWLAQLILHRVWPGDASYDSRVTAWEKSTSIADQNLWARATFDGLRACSLADIDVPVGQ